MNCKHFGSCGSCGLYNLDYLDALNEKKSKLDGLIGAFYSDDIEVFKSPTANHRARAEFKIWHIGDSCHYAMGNLDKNGIEVIESCPKVIKPIESLLEPLLEHINSQKELKHKLFAIEFLSGKSGEVLVTLIYHRKLDDNWEEFAKELKSSFNIEIIGRSRKQKIVLNRAFIEERLNIDGEEFKYNYYEGGFTQPNPYINESMIEWALKNIKDNGGDFLEAYCGLGNFTLPLSRYFNRVLATEISSNSIKAAKENCILNNINNITFVRLNAQETAEAIEKVREFRRLKGVDLDSYNFSTILVDPPRAGLDEASLKLAQKMQNILYISCNPTTLARDLEELTKTRRVVKAAMFDQFPYTEHIESGVYLTRKDSCE